MLDPSAIEEGMTVRDCEGRKVGWVLGVGDGRLHVGRGWFSVMDSACRLGHVTHVDVRGGQVLLDCQRCDLARASPREEEHYASGGGNLGFLPERMERPVGPVVTPVRTRRERLGVRLRHLRKRWLH